MKVLIVGGGGREHAIAQSVAKSEKVDKIYCTPGNAGIAALAECAPIGAMEFDKIVAFAKEKEVDLVIVGTGKSRNSCIRSKEKCSNSGRLQSIFKRFNEKIQYPNCSI